MKKQIDWETFQHSCRHRLIARYDFDYDKCNIGSYCDLQITSCPIWASLEDVKPEIVSIDGVMGLVSK